MSQLNDAQLKELFSQAAAVLEKRLYPEPPSAEELRERYTLPEEYERKVRGLRKSIKSRRTRKTLKTLFVIAAVISVMVLFALCMGAKEGMLFYMKTSATTYDNGAENYTRMIGEAASPDTEDEQAVIFPSYIPEGYAPVPTQGIPGEYLYSDGEHSFIYMHNTLTSSFVSNSEKYALKQIQIGNCIAYYYESEEQDYIFMIMKSAYGCFTLRGDIPLEECVRIFESLEQ